jgi:glycosyltransferase involved in cell wall biosynthesis
MAKVDIAVPCYNYGRFLRDCVASVLDQGTADVRVLIIDNASTDNSVEIARALAAKDRRISVSAHATNLGPHASFNEGVDWASADYFMILCSDDLLVPGALASMVAAMDRDPRTSFAYGNDVEWNYCESPSPPVLGAPSAARWRVREGLEFIYERCRFPDRHVSYSTILARTSTQKAAGHYRPELPHADDFEMLLRLACFGRVADTRDIVGVRRIHQSNRSQDYILKRTGHIVERLDAFESFFANDGRTLPGAERLYGIARSSLSGQAYWRGIKDLVRGRRSALQLLGLSIRLAPMTAVVPPFGYLARMDRTLYKSIVGLP